MALPTAADLASYLQKDVDTSSATLVLAIALGTFSRAADTAFAATSVTYSTKGGPGRCLKLPFRPVTAVSAVRLNGLAITDWTLVKNALYRQAGFGTWCAFPPDLVEVDLTHGVIAPGDDVKGAVLETAAQAYEIPVGVTISESIDDYAVRYATAGGGLQLTKSAADLAALYRGTLAT